MAFPEDLWPTLPLNTEVLRDDLHTLWADKMRDLLAKAIVDFLGKDDYHSTFDSSPGAGDPRGAELLTDPAPESVCATPEPSSVPIGIWDTDAFWQQDK